MKLTYRCQVCGEPILTTNGLVMHIQKTHNIEPQEYYERYMKKDCEGICPVCQKPTAFQSIKYGYNKYCSHKCYVQDRSKSAKECDLKCEICNFTIKDSTHAYLARKFSHHLKTAHNKTIKEYYDLFLKKPGEGFCKHCGKPTNFDSLFRGYNPCCSGRCAAYAIRKTDTIEEHKFKKENEEIKQTKEDEYKNYIQELKDRVHAFDWQGERNTWAGGPIATSLNEKEHDKNNLITNNNITYIDGQEYSSKTQTIINNDETNINDVFWL